MTEASASAEAAVEAVVNSDMTMGVEKIGEVTHAIADTTNWFVVFFGRLFSGLTWDNVLMQCVIVAAAVLAGLAFSRWVHSLVGRMMPPEGAPDTFSTRMKRLILGVISNVSFGVAAGSVNACCAYAAAAIGYSPTSFVILRIAYSIFYAYSLLAVVLGFLQAMMGRMIITPAIHRTVTVVFWVLAVLHFFGVLTHLVNVLDSTAIPIGSGSMTVWKFFMAICSVLLTLAVANWAVEIIEQTISASENLTGNVKVVLARIIRIFCMVIAVIIGLGTVGIDLTILSVFGGALGVGLGFGLQKIASNYISGFIILLDKSIKIGDLVSVGGFKGKVTEINTRFTVVRGADGVEDIVPNESFVTSAVLNHSYSETPTLQSVIISVAYDADVKKALEIMLDEANQPRPRICKDKRAWVGVDKFADSGIDLSVNFWVEDPVNGTAGLRTDISLCILKRFADAGIEIPYNRLDVAIVSKDKGAEAA